MMNRNGMEPTNEDRALAAQEAIQLHSMLLGDAAESPEEGLIDLLADLQHWAAQVQLDYDAALLTARAHYAVEKLEARA